MCVGHGLRSESQATGSGPGLTGLSDSATGVTGQAHINLDSTKRPTPCQPEIRVHHHDGVRTQALFRMCRRTAAHWSLTGRRALLEEQSAHSALSGLRPAALFQNGTSDSLHVENRDAAGDGRPGGSV